MSRRPPARRVRAFTLMELMASVSIIAILAVMAIPNIRSVVGNERLLAEAYGVGAWIYDARMLAVGLKRCIRVRAYTTGPSPTPASTEYNVDIGRMSAWELESGDCETPGTITADANYSRTSLPDFAIPATFTMRLQPTVTSVPIIWRPVGYARGNADDNFADDGFQLRITDRRGKFVVVVVSTFGQVCTGSIDEPNPSC